MKYIVVVLFAVLVVAVHAAQLNVRRIVNVNAPPAPTNFVVLMNGANTTNVFLSWGNTATNYANIVVERSIAPPTWSVITNLNGTNVAFTNIFTWSGTPVYYRIKSTTANGLDSLYANEP